MTARKGSWSSGADTGGSHDLRAHRTRHHDIAGDLIFVILTVALFIEIAQWWLR